MLKYVKRNVIRCQFGFQTIINCLCISLNLVTVSAKAREITVTGPRGSLHRSFKHLAVDIQVTEVDGGKQLKVDLWFGNRETIAAVRYLQYNCVQYIVAVCLLFLCLFSFQNRVLSHREHDHRCHQGFLVQDEILLCSLSYQRVRR
jgi:hypothetical protein